jgi:pimeloyl-ACP methyl ester carboxylesterase
MTAPDGQRRFELPPLDADLLPEGVRSRFVDSVNGLRMHVLEAGHASPARPCVLLLHGFPELAYSWRRVMAPLADAGFHVVAPDQRGYGRTTGWDPRYDGDLPSFRPLNLVRDLLALVAALGRREVAAVVGHDFGAPIAAWCALARPDVFRSVAMMSAPFAGAPAWPEPPDASRPPDAVRRPDVHAELAALARPRKHYQSYYSTPQANGDMLDCPQGVHDFLRAYYHVKSADWPGNRPFPLAAWSAAELAKMPTYYVMDLDADMPGTVAGEMPTAAQIACCRWLPDRELRVYVDEFSRTGFQGGLQWYRCANDPRSVGDLALFSGRRIEVPACFVAGAQDWGPHQRPGALASMQAAACARFEGRHLIEGAGHWVQQERPEETVRLLRAFLGV